jgi:predicted component of viral defense system (DUF524 family)
MGHKFIFKSDNVGEFHLETSDVNLPEIIKKTLHNYNCKPDFTYNGFRLISDNINLLEYPCFFDWQSIKVVFIPGQFGENEKYSFLINETHELESGYYGGKPQIIGSIQIKNYVGNTTFKVVNKYNETIFKFTTEVFPQKLDYKNDFKLMISEITEILYALIYDYLKKTYYIVKPTEPQHSSTTEWLAILKALFDSLERSLQLIIRSPHSKIITDRRIRQIDKIRKVDGSSVKWIIRHQNFLNVQGSTGFEIMDSIYAESLQESKKRITHNTFENRFIKWAINNIILKMEIVRHDIKLLKLNKQDIERAENELIAFRKKLIRYLKNPVFHQVEDFQNQMNFSTVLTMAPGYKDFYFRFLLLRRGLSINDNDIFKLDYKDIAKLYEYWCFLKTIKILKEEPFSYNLESTDIIKLEHTRFSIDLRKGKESEIKFSKYVSGESFILAYNREFRTPTYMQIPDNFIEFRKGHDYKNPFRYIMDAKYRFTREDTDYPETKVKNGPPLDTIAQLHRYRDAILSKSPGRQTYSEAIKSLGGIILFPFPGVENEFKEHKFYRSIRDVNIGAIPLRPGSENNLYKQFLLELLETTPEYLYERTINYDKSDYIKVQEWTRTPVLIGRIPHRDFNERMDFFRAKKIYHLPKARKFLIPPDAIKVVAINPADQPFITLYGNVISVRTMNNDQLQKLGVDWPQRGTEYTVFYLDDLKECKIPFSQISMMGRRYTNLFSLKKSMEPGMEEVIFLSNPEQVRVWKEIYELDKKVQIKRNSRFDRSNHSDESEIEFIFTYKDNLFNCIQNSQNKGEFIINEQKYLFGENFREFILK